MSFSKRRYIMLSKKVVELLNDQVNKEFYSAYLYLDMSNYYKNEGLDGFANWYKVQAQEERDHCGPLHGLSSAETGEAVVLEAIAKPDKEFRSFIDPLKEGADHERYVTRAYTQYLRRCLRRKGLQDNAVPRLVCKGAG